MARSITVLALGLGTGVNLLLCPPAIAQQWELEVHGGVALTHTPRSGESSLPPPGPSIPTYDVGTSRRVASWLFGDGSTQLNQVIASLGRGPQLVPLDPVLRSQALARDAAGSFGFRLGRRLNARLTAELSVDWNLARLKLSGDTLAGIEVTRASFVPAWSNVLSPFTSPAATSVATLRDRGGRQLVVTGALSVSLKTTGRLTPYLTLGGGYLSNSGDTLGATLVGDYQFQVIAVYPRPLLCPICPNPLVLSPIHETDTVTLRYTSESSFFGMLGFGLKYQVSPRWGIRADVRAHLVPNRTQSRLDASPATDSDALAHASVGVAPAPTLRFGSGLNPDFSPARTLSGERISGFETFTGTGIQSRLAVTAGVFLSF